MATCSWAGDFLVSCSRADRPAAYHQRVLQSISKPYALSAFAGDSQPCGHLCCQHFLKVLVFSLHDWLSRPASRDRYRTQLAAVQFVWAFFVLFGRFFSFTVKHFSLHADFHNHELFSRAQCGVCVPGGLAARLFSGLITRGCRFCRGSEFERHLCVRTCISGSALPSETEDKRLKSAKPRDGMCPREAWNAPCSHGFSSPYRYSVFRWGPYRNSVFRWGQNGRARGIDLRCALQSLVNCASVQLALGSCTRLQLYLLKFSGGQ